MSRTMDLIEDVSESDAIITAQSLPALTGTGSEDLLCAGCGQVLAAKLNNEAITNAFRTDKRLLLRCTCGASNLVALNETPSTLQ